MESIDFFKHKNKNVNTTKATNTWYRRYCTWATENGWTHNLENLDALSLNETLENFFAEIKKVKGGNYEPTTLGAIQAGLHRYLKETGSTISIYNDPLLQGSRDVVEGRARYFRQDLGLGKKPNRANSLNATEEEHLWESGQLGNSNARSLANTMWFLMSQHFGLRGRQEHHTMNVQDFVFRKDDVGNEYVTFAEGYTKTRQGGTHQKERVVKPKMFATGADRCPLKIFREFMLRRPEELRENGPFYLAVIENPVSNIWFKKSRMGVNSIDSIMKRMKGATPELAGSIKKLTNHSARKTVIKKLKRSKIPKSEIIGITGHSAETGLDPYDSGDEETQREHSHIIDQHAPSTSTERPFATTYDKSSLPPKNFRFFSDSEYDKIGGNTIMNFKNCNVTISNKCHEPTIEKRRKRVRIMESSGSSQEC